MATTAISIVDAPLNEIKAYAFTSATSASDGFAISVNGADNRLAFLITNKTSDSATVTFKKGNGLQGVADLVYDLPASTASGLTYLVWIDSGLIKNVTGANKGKVVAIPSATTVEIAAVHLGRIASESVTY